MTLTTFTNLRTKAKILRPTGTIIEITKHPKKSSRNSKMPRVIKKNSGTVISLLVKLSNGDIIEDSVPTTHQEVCERANINLDDIIGTGWLLDNKNEVWR